MTPKDVKVLLKTLIVEEGLPIDVVDMAPSQNLAATTTEARIKDVITQWNKAGRIHVLLPGLPEIMEFYTQTDADASAKELLEAAAVEALLESVIAEQGLPIRFTDCGFRLITLSEDDTTRYPVKILHGGFRLEKWSGTEVEPSELEAVAHQFETSLKANGLKAKLFHRGFQLEKRADVEMPLSEVSKIAGQIGTTLSINYVLNAYEYANCDEASETSWTSASICVSLWRLPWR